MDNPPGASKTIQCLEQLRELVRDVAAREEKLEKEHGSRIAALRKKRDAAIDAAGKEREALETASRQSADEEGLLAAQKFERRTKVIQDAFLAAQKHAIKRAEEEEGRRKYRLQTEGMQAKREHETGVSRTEKRYNDFTKAMESVDKQLTRLEEDAYEAMRGFPSFRSLLADQSLVNDPSREQDEDSLALELKQTLVEGEGKVRAFRWKPLAVLFRVTPLWIILLLCVFLLVPVASQLGIPGFHWTHAFLVSLGGMGLLGALFLLGRQLHSGAARMLARDVMKARRWHACALERSNERHTRDLAEIEGKFGSRGVDIEQRWGDTASAGQGLREVLQQKVQDKGQRVAVKHEEWFAARQSRIEQGRLGRLAGIQAAAEAAIAEARRQYTDVETRLVSEREEQLAALQRRLQEQVPPIQEAGRQSREAAARHFDSWDSPAWRQWSVPPTGLDFARVGEMEVDVARLAGALPREPRLQMPLPERFSWPVFLLFPEEASLLLEGSGPGRDQAAATLNNAVLRILSITPPGRIALTLVDPVGLGQTFAGIMHLADHAEHMIQGRIWTQPEQIDRRLADLNQHMEKVIQMYLRNEYATIADYNRQAGVIAEKVHLLVVADFPSGFTDASARRLLSIAASGARCGVFTLIHWDDRQPMPADFPSEDLRRTSICISCRGNDAQFRGHPFTGATLRLDAPPPTELAIDLVHRVGRGNKDGNRVEVPFSHITPQPAEVWSLDTTEELRVAIGRTGATKLQYLSLGKGTRQHALLAGKTGSGKSTLFHAIITNLSLWCSPDAVQFYLIDFKKGVEFKCYATHRTPHVKVVAIESDREFGLSVLQKLDEELRRRGDLFRRLGTQDLPGYKRAGAREPLPRILLMIDEFQEFFVEDDKVAQGASLLLDRIVRQGRAFGIHVVLGSQTLGGAYTVARATLGQMVVRIALQCNEADSHLIMDENNGAARLLSRPGEGIYNDAAGASEANSPFQAVWIPDTERDKALAQVQDKAAGSGRGFDPPFVYEGDAPAEAEANPLLNARLSAASLIPPQAAVLWLGAPNSIKGPTELVFRPQSGKNLLIVGQREDAVLAMLSVGMIALAAQFPQDQLRLVILDGTSPGTPERAFLDRIGTAIPHQVVWTRDVDLGELLSQLAAEVRHRAESGTTESGRTFILVNGLQKYKKLRNEDEFSISSDDQTANPAVDFNKLITEGPAVGFHVIVACDGYNNVSRFLNRKTLGEFEMRVLFQMSANDSASLIDTPKAGSLGLHRAVYYNDQEGSLEVFRPYALPTLGWVEQAGTQLARLHPAR